MARCARAAAAPPEPVPAATARALFLHAQELAADPARPATPARVRRAVERMGFVQVDTIAAVERAHHHVLMSRFDAYRPPVLTRLLERERALFEHWTHDAAAIPTSFYRYWHPRFAHWRRWYAERVRRDVRGASVLPRLMRQVRRRIEREGPAMARDFADPGLRRRGWWDWKPAKVALEALWRTGELAVVARVHFHKVYDLADRALAGPRSEPKPTAAEHRRWACESALARLGVATPAELARFWDMHSVAEAAAWCERAVREGRAVRVELAAENGAAPRAAVALPDWRRRAARAPTPPARMRLLSPFDPVVRDRERLARLFAFDYRLEAFVPAARRRYGYFVLPVLEGDRFVARLDPKLHRHRSLLEVRRVWWEAGVRPTGARRRRLAEAVERFAEQQGARGISLPRGARP